MKDFPFLRGGPRYAGICEHHQRIKWFGELASSSKDEVARHRLHLAGVYSARAICDLMLTAAEMGEIPGHRNTDRRRARKGFEAELAPRVPFYALLEVIRIHDFHRFGVLPPHPNVSVFFGGGPMKLMPSKGYAQVQYTPTGPVESTTGGSRVQSQRDLLNADGHFFDDSSNRFVPLQEVLSQFLAGAPALIEWFQSQQ